MSRAVAAVCVRAVAVFALAVLAAACAPSLPASYHCSSDAQCRFGGQQGRCETSGACSFPDVSCASGSRYGQLGPAGIAGACVAGGPTDGGGGGGGGGDGDLGTGGPSHIMRVGSVTVPRAARASVTLSPVADTAAGDFVLAVVLVSTSTVTVAAPTGWTVQQEISDNLAADYRAVYFQHTTSASDPPTWSFVLSGSAAVVAAEVAYRNVDTTAPIDATGTGKFQGATFTAPTITTTHANDYLVTMFVQAQNMTLGWQPPPDMQVAVTQGDIGIFDVEQPVAGPTGTKTASFNIGAVPGIGAVDFVALAPKP